jgi:hypothetical protein
MLGHTRIHSNVLINNFWDFWNSNKTERHCFLICAINVLSYLWAIRACFDDTNVGTYSKQFTNKRFLRYIGKTDNNIMSDGGNKIWPHNNGHYHVVSLFCISTGGNESPGKNQNYQRYFWAVALIMDGWRQNFRPLAQTSALSLTWHMWCKFCLPSSLASSRLSACSWRAESESVELPATMKWPWNLLLRYLCVCV